MTIKAIAKPSQVHRVTVSAWSKQWAQQGVQSLPDQPRRGRPSTLTPDEQTIAQQSIKEEPRSLQGVGERWAHTTEKRLSLSTRKRLAKKARLRWKRVRKSWKKLRDPDACAHGQRELAALQKQEDQGKLALYYFDEAGFALEPTIPYAWQEPKSVIELPAIRYGRINVWGFMNRTNELHAFMFAQSIHTGVVIACCDAFWQTMTTKTVVVVDNASIHRSEDFEDRIPYWKKRGLIIKYLRPYSPELTLIEILWRRIKYTWLPCAAYECLNALSEALETILSQVGSEYQITFA
jgi:transposase